MNRFFIIGILLDVALNLLLIPRWHAFGSAVAAVATQSFVAASLVWLSVQTFGFRPSSRGVLRLLGFALFVVSTDFVLFYLLDWLWWIQFGGALGAGLIGLFLFKMLDFRQIKNLRT
jgi:O-antigen/teichoic acid export membrane protein